MDDPRIQNALKSIESKGDPVSALQKGKAMETYHRKQPFWPFLLTGVLSAGVALAIAIPLTSWAVSPKGESLYGSGEVVPGVSKVLSETAHYFYNKPIQILLIDNQVFGELYYCFNDATKSIIVAHIDTAVCASIDIANINTPGGGDRFTTKDYLVTAFSGFTGSLAITIKDFADASHIWNPLTLDTEPYYNYVMSKY